MPGSVNVLDAPAIFDGNLTESLGETAAWSPAEQAAHEDRDIVVQYNTSLEFHKTAIGEAWGARAPVNSSSIYSLKQKQCMQFSLLLEDKEGGVSIPQLMCCNSIAAK